MFDFQKLEVYHKAKEYNHYIHRFLRTNSFDRTTNDQLRRASFSIMLNIAEGSARFSNRDRRRFLVIARGSVFECVAILEYLLDTNQLDNEGYQHFFDQLEGISKILFALIRKLE